MVDALRYTKKTHISWTNEGMKEWPTHYLLACDFFLERYPNSPRFAGSDMLFCQQNNAFYYTLFKGVSVGVFRAWLCSFFFEYVCSTNPKQWWICWLTNQRNHLSCETHHLWGASLRKQTPWMIILHRCIARGSWVLSSLSKTDWGSVTIQPTRKRSHIPP